MFTEFTADYKEAVLWGWNNWKLYIDELTILELTTDNVVAWMKQGDLVRKMLFEVRERLTLATMIDTTDEAGVTALNNFMVEISLAMDKAFFALDTKLVDSGLAPKTVEIPLRNLKNELRLFNEDNLPLMAQLSQLGLQYNQIAGAQTVEWEGKTVSLLQLAVAFKDTNRERRKTAWILQQRRKKQDREKHNVLWKNYMDLRGQVAKNAGFDDYRQYAWLRLNRHDYTPEDAIQFTEAVLQVVVPAAERLRERQRKHLGYETMHPWDLQVDPRNRAPLRPYTDIKEFIDKAESIFYKVDPELGANFTTMKTGNLLDLENRSGKGPGGQAMVFDASDQAFIFMNAVNVAHDVTTLLHEAGHGFHTFAKRDLDYMLQRWVTAEFNEVASMAMELLASPYLTDKQGGYFTEVEAARFRADHMREIIHQWTFIAIGVAFQHWVYTHHEAATDPTNCDTKWMELWSQYQRGVDWGEYKDFILNGWRSLPHFFHTPFYMIEYGLAQLGAVQIYANSLQDQAGALKKYREALALGGTVTLPKLYEVAGARLAFDAKTLKSAVDLLESQIEYFDALQIDEVE